MMFSDHLLVSTSQGECYVVDVSRRVYDGGVIRLYFGIVYKTILYYFVNLKDFWIVNIVSLYMLYLSQCSYCSTPE